MTAPFYAVNRITTVMTDNELRVAMWLDAPLTWKEIADRLHLPVETVRGRAKLVYRKLRASNRLEAIAAWERAGQP